MDYPMAMPPVPAAATAARLLARDVVTRAVGPADAEAAELAVSEMVTAALAGVDHAPDGPPVRLAFQVDGGRVAVEVGVDVAGDDRLEQVTGYGMQLLSVAAPRIEMRVDESGVTRRIEIGEPDSTQT
ncbi:ATP-binding protein [Microbispora sp. SCL1-1]|uniref:ATP-binding protein n=1 Tax=unclassified Microbispora TaxID=2614687 RepID=UPI001159D504|nr:MULTISPECIES: ATP-binding protein [unclassified Microbispora]NJP27126.1 ATP-binding protein [Microbispora sp. CL1-1]TQS11471.1 ATP-binding protein [Microbispora sp. SCL1-1]